MYGAGYLAIFDSTYSFSPFQHAAQLPRLTDYTFEFLNIFSSVQTVYSGWSVFIDFVLYRCNFKFIAYVFIIWCN
jgi:hypothetical protein